MSLSDIVKMLPFALLLMAMAATPIFAPKWWLKHYPKVALGLGAVTASYYIFILKDTTVLKVAMHEYVSFIALVGSLFVVSGGIHIGVTGEARPLLNTLFLLMGAVLANLLGTTGAAMLLIRPWIRMNKYRVTGYHIVFFIFVVANIGGCLTPIGDPPLFLGFLHGVPFWWVTKNCWPMWMLGVSMLLGIFYLLDRKNFLRAPKTVRDLETGRKTWTIEGAPNLVFVGVILGAVFIEKPSYLREGVMIAAAVASYFTTRKSVHVANGFNFHPISEVAVLFAGIFTTMIPALAWLNESSRTLLGDQPSPAVFYWGTGILSSALDNAPTYLGFLSALKGIAGVEQTAGLFTAHAHHVLAISIASVFFGAATYIGNGPNFMVKSIAEQSKIKMPTFLEFVLRYSLPYLLPVLIVVWLLSFRG